MFQLGSEGKVRISRGKVFQMKGLVGAKAERQEGEKSDIS